MELLITHFPTMYLYLSGTLISWGVFALHSLIITMTYAQRVRGKIRRLDVLYFLGILSCTGIIATALLLCPVFFSQYIFGMFIFELWYLLFALHFTAEYIKPCIDNCTKSRLPR